MPPLTLSHSTMTVPLNAASSVGVRTTMRVVYSARSSVAYDDAVPDTKNSSAR